jgi:dihydroxyacetone kinase
MASPLSTISTAEIISAMHRACASLQANSEHLTSLDQAVGDGDLGITVSKISVALEKYIQDKKQSDPGKLLIGAGMETNRAAPSTMGTLLATALIRMGREITGKENLENDDLIRMLIVAGNAIKERGKANIGDKTALDVIVPAGEAFKEAIENGKNLTEAAKRLVTAAENGRDKMTPLKNRVGRASWLGERTIGLVDPGCEMMVIILKAIVNC